MTRPKIIKKLQENGKELANMGTETVEKAYKATLDILSTAKRDAPELLSNLVKKGEAEWDEIRKTLDKLYREKSTLIATLHKEIKSGLEDLRDKIVKESPVDLSRFFELMHRIEAKIGSLDVPFVKQVMQRYEFPIADYDSLSVKKIIPLLENLNSEQLHRVADYEKKHLNRVTVLREIAKKCR